MFGDGGGSDMRVGNTCFMFSSCPGYLVVALREGGREGGVMVGNVPALDYF